MPASKDVEVLDYLREKESMTLSDLLRGAHQKKVERDVLVERFAVENLVRVDGKTVTSTSYSEFVAALYAKKDLPAPVDLRAEYTTPRETAA